MKPSYRRKENERSRCFVTDITKTLFFISQVNLFTLVSTSQAQGPMVVPNRGEVHGFRKLY